jgi:DNA polymerase-1
VSSPYGKECRELFEAGEGFELLGADMAGLEGRCLAHFLAKYDDGAYGELMLSGDPHWAVVKALGFTQAERDKDNPVHTIMREIGGKRTFYAMTYGAGMEKTGRCILEACRLIKKVDPEWDGFFDQGTPTKRQLQQQGAAAKRAVVDGIPGMAQLMRAIRNILLDQEGKGTMTVPGLDGRRMPVRSEHKALNVLLQGAGAVLCKRWIVDAYDALIAAGLVWGEDFAFVAWVHDELQIAVRQACGKRFGNGEEIKLSDFVGNIVVRTAQEAGKPYGFRIKLDSTYKVGASWADTH